MLTQRVLHQQADLFLFYPPPAGRLHGRPRNAAASLRFATLHREIDFVTSRIAGYHLELGAEHVVEQRGILIRIVGHSAGADHELSLLSILERLDAGGVPGDANTDLIIGAADVVEPPAVVLGGLVAQQRLERHGAGDGSKRRAVLRADVIEPVGEPHPAASIHILRHDGRIARHVLAQMPRNHPGIEVVAAADAHVDVKVDVLAPIELGRRLRRRGRRRGGREHSDANRACKMSHAGVLLAVYFINAPALAASSGGARSTSATSFSSASPETGLTSNCPFSASARKSVSAIVSMNAFCRVRRRSAGMPGGPWYGRPMTWRAKMNLNMARCSSVV